ncbi:MAG: MBL fold metallo-hydrolase [Firmicutes bacterium]|nr:MBL fold metallo-hydrolase [Bacillota bacterium]
MKITMLGTGHAGVTGIYNTCFVLSRTDAAGTSSGADCSGHFLVDGGGGNRLLTQLKAVGIGLMDIHDVFITHKHLDHLLGIFWLLRMTTSAMVSGRYKGELRIYAHDELIHILRESCSMLFGEKQNSCIGKQLHLIEVRDGDCHTVLGHPCTFFDIDSTKAKQFGFTLEYAEGKRLCCLGDEPFNPVCRKYVEGSEWLMHEAFCLYSQAERFKPYEKSHSTVKDACKNAAKLRAKNLILYHTEEDNIEQRRALYEAEGRPYFGGGLYVPYDLDVIEL